MVMQIVLTIDGKQKNAEVSDGASVNDVMKESGINNEVVIIKLNNKISHPQTQLKPGDALELVNVIYGG